MNKELVKLILSSSYRYRDGIWSSRGKSVSADKAVSALRKLIGDTDESVNEEQLELAALEDQQLDLQDVSERYIQASPYLRHFYWKASAGVLTLYYSPMGSKEVVPLPLEAAEGHRPFLNAIREVPQWLSRFMGDFEEQRQHSKKLTVDGFAQQLFKTIVVTPSQQLVDEPKSISWVEDEFSFKSFNPSQILEGPTPSWDEFLSRLSSSEIFLAFIWSIFEERNFGRQVLWLKGPGNDGKSRVISAISRYLGSHAVAALSQGTVSSQFFSSFVYGKRLVVFGDCMHTRLISTSAIHTLVGGDYASIEAKGKQAFAGRIYSKVIVGSNYSPEIDNTANQISRLLYVTVRPLVVADSSQLLPSGDDSNFEDRLVAEFPYLLHRARQAYSIRSPNHGRINLSQSEVEDMLTKTKSDMQEFVERFCQDNLIQQDGAITSCGDLNAFFLSEAAASGLKTNQQLDLNLLNRYVEEKMSLEKIRIPGQGVKTRGWSGVSVSSKFQKFLDGKILYQ